MKELLKLIAWTVFVSPVVVGMFIVWCLCWIVWAFDKDLRKDRPSLSGVLYWAYSGCPKDDVF